MTEMKQVAAGVGATSEKTAVRLARGAAMPGEPGTWDKEAALARLREIMAETMAT
jgi:hypothetical protein